MNDEITGNGGMGQLTGRSETNTAIGQGIAMAQQKELPRVLGLLNLETSELEKNIETLLQRLRPITRQDTPSSETQKDPEYFEIDVAKAIYDQVQVLRMLNRGLISADRLLEI